MAKFRLKSPELTEKDVVEACKDVLMWRGYKLVRLHVGLYKTLDHKRYQSIGEKGLPDYLAVHAKYPALFIEFKRPRKIPEPHQAEKIRELRETYNLSVIAVDRVEDLIVWLNENHEDRS
jgi:hypothetical protein